MSNIPTRVSSIVLPVAESTNKLPLQTVESPALGGIILRQQIWAPAWFYSALNWLSRTYTDANNAQQSFGPSMYGSDVDPYAQLGSTRLFCITQQRNSAYFTLYLAQDTDSSSLGAGNTYPNTDDGIKAMYTALSASSIFSAVKFCYIPGLLGSDINPTAYTAVAYVPPATLQSGYDPSTGLRVIAQGSAVSQVVPLDQFQNSHNEQIYDTTPTIVPVASSLVYDVTQFNQVGAKQFLLPVFYARDRVQGSYYVNKICGTTTINNQTAQCGQIAVYAGGPGYNASTATPLEIESVAPSQPLSTYTFSNNNGIVVSSVNPGTGVNPGITSLTYSASSPAALFANQRLVGFARSSAWLTSFGIPIFDYGSGNSSFTLPPSVAVLTPTPIYTPTTPFLNGGSIANVVRSLLQATYLYPTSKLISILNTATTSQTTDGGAGLSVTTAALQFAMSSNETTIADQLSFPVVATFTTTPILTQVGGPQFAAAASAAVAAPSAVAAKVAATTPPAAAIPPLATAPRQPNPSCQHKGSGQHDGPRQHRR